MRAANNTGYLLQHLASVLSKQSDQVLQERLSMGFSQFKILMALQHNARTPQRNIAEALGQTEASISRQIKLMLEMGLLESRVSPESRRVHLTTPTKKGLQLAAAAMQVLNEYHGPMYGALSDAQQEHLLQALATMHEYACQAGKLSACDHPLSN